MGDLCRLARPAYDPEASDVDWRGMEIVAIVVAAGRGSRAGDGLPKQYRDIGGRPLLAWTLERFLSHRGVDRVLCVIHPDDLALYRDAMASLPNVEALMEPAYGGATRQISVRQALESLAGRPHAESTLCLIHDGARMFASHDLIDRAIAAGKQNGAAVPGLALTDTVKRVDADGAIVETLDRAMLRIMQTPQVFDYAPLLEAHRTAAKEGIDHFTDDATLAGWAGLSVHIFEGEATNMKVTVPGDFLEAERRVRGDVALTSRVATGFDVHVFGPGDHIWLGGVRVPHSEGIVAHSDGDVVLHALTDALLGTLGDGDIGTHFPPSDPQWRGAASDRFLLFAADRVRQAGGRIDHLDATVLCERPKVGPYREAMRSRIADIVGLPVAAVSVKATTTERLGFTGRGEGIAAQAAATVRLPSREN